MRRGRRSGCARAGPVAADFTWFHGPRTRAQGAATAIRLATLSDGGPSGAFFEDDGVIPR
ncbi:hypothetical protein J2X68_004599 [Streptomyces sp. 3330]|uniref:hypothetical protein n=1 Tax=Streptomyces sp. 3330 TaxID=2817755 RepID=UPI002855C20E|nr:hypothetical protein [Streptomyces sp. 3330]